MIDRSILRTWWDRVLSVSYWGARVIEETQQSRNKQERELRRALESLIFTDFSLCIL